MGFRDFITNFRYRRKVQRELERYQTITPPANPSRRYIDKRVAQLLNQETAWNARKELSMMGAAVVPSLLTAISDHRYHVAEWSKFSIVPAPLHSVLELLISHAGNDVERVALPLVKSPSAEVRKAAALHLASLGRTQTIPVLQELLQDEDGYVRSCVRIGMDRAVSSGRADEDFRDRAYDLLLSQCDQDWGIALNDAPETVVVLNRDRAAVDFADERWLNPANENAYRILDACNDAGILLPEHVLRKLLDYSLPLAAGPECHPHNYVAAAALKGLALRSGESAKPLAERLLNHENEKIQEASAEALAAISGLVDPAKFVCERVQAAEYRSLSPEQRVVFCAFLFDAEVYEGGLLQFFGNSSGDHVDDTLAALRELAHAEAESALKTAITLVGPLAREPDRELRMTAFEERFEALQALFAPLEKAYYRTRSRLRQAWLLYATRHPSHFRSY